MSSSTQREIEAAADMARQVRPVGSVEPGADMRALGGARIGIVFQIEASPCACAECIDFQKRYPFGVLQG